MPLKEAVRALWPWRLCYINQVWGIDEFPRDALTSALPSYKEFQHGSRSIEHVIRDAMRRMIDKGETL
jgi:predicted RNase H-like nuclease (RuvC/YqgF family)